MLRPDRATHYLLLYYSFMKHLLAILLLLPVTAMCQTKLDRDATVDRYAPTVYPLHAKKILFIGNSFTNYNHMTQTVQRMCDDVNEPVKIEQVALDGFNLMYHFTDTGGGGPIAIKKLTGDDCDILVLQDAPVPLLIPEERKYWYEPAVIKFDSVIKSKHARTFLFQNYSLENLPLRYRHPTSVVERNARKFDPYVTLGNNNECCSDSFINSTQEFDSLQAVTENMARKINGSVVKVGYAFELYKSKYPDMSLYTFGNHPNAYGSYLIACMFYIAFTGKNAYSIKYYASLPEKTAKQLQEIADMVILR